MKESTIDRRHQVAGQYSKVVACGNHIYLSGLIPENWDLDMRAQAREVFRQIDELLAEFSSDRSSLLSVQVYIQSFDEYAEFKEEYGKWIDPDNLPARATVQAELLDSRIKIEIMAVASRP